VGNDFIVTVQSAQFQPTNSVGFQPLTTWHVNHSTIGYSQVTPSNPLKYPDVAQTLCNRFIVYGLKAPLGSQPLQSDIIY
jgi:hypothetical protein